MTWHVVLVAAAGFAAAVAYVGLWLLVYYAIKIVHARREIAQAEVRQAQIKFETAVVERQTAQIYLDEAQASTDR